MISYRLGFLSRNSDMFFNVELTSRNFFALVLISCTVPSVSYDKIPVRTCCTTVLRYCQCSSFSERVFLNASSTSLKAMLRSRKLCPRRLSVLKPEMKSEYFTDSRKRVSFRLVCELKR